MSIDDLPTVNVRLIFHTRDSGPRVLSRVTSAIEAHRQAGNPIPKLPVYASAPPHPSEGGPPSVTIGLTFRTTEPSSVVLEQVMAAIRRSRLMDELRDYFSVDLDDGEEE